MRLTSNRKINKESANMMPNIFRSLEDDVKSKISITTNIKSIHNIFFGDFHEP